MKTFLYKGPSMHPTLRDMDMLYVLPYDARPVSCGDVVVYSTPGSDGYIVHRIVRMANGGIQTRGDNCNAADRHMIQPESIIGYVGHVQRRGKHISVCNGYKGQLTAFDARVFRKMKFILKKAILPVYTAVVNTGVLNRLLFLLPAIRILSFNRPDGKKILYLSMGRRVIGKRLPGKDGWQIVWPMRLIVNESAGRERL